MDHWTDSTTLKLDARWDPTPNLIHGGKLGREIQ
jgi:hypothetical protein